jgi:hypothetical protein
MKQKWEIELEKAKKLKEEIEKISWRKPMQSGGVQAKRGGAVTYHIEEDSLTVGLCHITIYDAQNKVIARHSMICTYQEAEQWAKDWIKKRGAK